MAIFEVYVDKKSFNKVSKGQFKHASKIAKTLKVGFSYKKLIFPLNLFSLSRYSAIIPFLYTICLLALFKFGRNFGLEFSLLNLSIAIFYDDIAAFFGKRNKAIFILSGRNEQEVEEKIFDLMFKSSLPKTKKI